MVYTNTPSNFKIHKKITGEKKFSSIPQGSWLGLNISLTKTD